VVVENKPGAGGNIAADMVAHSDADGYTIFIVGPGMATNPFLYPSLSYDPVKDFEPVTLLITQPNLMCVPNSSPAKSVQEFIAFCNNNRGKVTYASSGNGTTLHLSGELFKRLAKVEMIHIPYRGGAPAINDLIPGRVDVIFDNMPSILSHVQAGHLRALAVTTKERVSVVPEIPTLDESGVPGFEVLVRLLRAGKNPAGGDRKNQRRHQRRAGPRLGKNPLRATRRRPERLDARGAGRLPEIGNRQMGPGDPRRQDQAGKLTSEAPPQG
jgi:tripartite-type tricarboxylate transporter receptor subunit TctC